MAFIDMEKNTTAPDTPATDHSKLYFDGAWKARLDDGSTVALTNDADEVSETANATRSANTYAQMGLMTLTLTTGTYMVFFSGSALVPGSQVRGLYALHQDGVIIQHTERDFHEMSGHSHDVVHTIFTMAKVTVTDASDVITLQWKNDDNSTTLTAYERSMTAIAI